MRRALSVLLIILACAGCSRSGNRPIRKTCAAVKAAVRGIYRLETAVTNGAVRPVFKSLDVEGMTASELNRELSLFKRPADARLWMPGEKSWIVVEQAPGVKISLAGALESLARDEKCTVTLPEIFANYAGTLAEILPAFKGDLRGDVLPEWFVPEGVGAVTWIDPSGVDGDILKFVSDETRSLRNVRREVLKGNMVARQKAGPEGEREACEIWARAMLRNPNETLLLERIDNLESNARAFLSAGKVVQAMKCFETIILIKPGHAAAVHNFGLCLKKLGKTDLAEKVLKRAEILQK